MRLDPKSALAIATLAAALLAVGCGPTYPNCDTDSNCHEGEYCVNGTCQQCRGNQDCPAGQACNAGRCDPIEGYCNGNGDCPQGQECQGNRCVTATQSTTEIPQDTTPTGPTGPCQLESPYFGFDSDELDSSTRDILQRNAACIASRNIAHVRVTGHCDPRGTEEYNLALGDRRARSVVQFMQSLGVARSVMAPRSMGEEMARGQDESSWAQDRRVQFEEQ